MQKQINLEWRKYINSNTLLWALSKISKLVRFCASETRPVSIRQRRTTSIGSVCTTLPETTISVDPAEDPGGGNDRCPTSIWRRRAGTRLPSRFGTTVRDCTICIRASSRARIIRRTTSPVRDLTRNVSLWCLKYIFLIKKNIIFVWF